MSSFDPKVLDKYSTDPGVYLMKSSGGNVLYVGKAKNLKTRIKQYFAPGRDGRPMVPFLIAEVASIDIIVVPSEKEALLLENTLIKKHQPKFNALLKDDKTFVSLMINHKHPWPRVELVRYKGKPKKDGLYFGPFTSAFAARQTFDLMGRLFPLRQCSDQELKKRTRPCLLYGIKRCVAPCVNLCTKEEYQSIVDHATHFLKGEDEAVIQQLKKEMHAASEALEYEKAAALLQMIKQIEHVTAGSGLVAKAIGKDTDALGLYRQGHDVMVAQLFFREGKLVGSEHYSFTDVVESNEELLSSFLVQYYKDRTPVPIQIIVPLDLPRELEEILQIKITTPQKGEKKEIVEMAEKNALVLFKQEKDDRDLTEKMLLDLQETLHLTRYPERIECFDTSNISGSDLVASMVVFMEGKYDKKESRLYKIKNVTKGDDYGALQEVLSRRLTRAKQENTLPDLIIVDGGKGQLGIGRDVLKSLDIATVDLISLAKQAGKHDKGLTQEKVFVLEQSEPIILPLHSPLLFLLQRIRDETHRRAIGFHRKRREKRLISSLIDEIPGIGDVKKKRLLKHFGSLQRILAASPADLLAVKGITSKDVEQIKKLVSNPKTS